MARVDKQRANHSSLKEFSRNNLENLSQHEFVEVWKIIAGEAPAIMLDSRTEMLGMLFEGVISEGLLNQVALAFPKTNRSVHR